ncbi:hypothetical protein BGW38_010701 [Lunasporangiospora selenospora]|uniref:GPI mannosyltransferase 2 n=1 Tax=Lunasporangiospora selenospora TaxID=979761 RepID=A0A9P6FY53_9FUNG|nr:hypothetical protein BGW38_010701 [Lunasporangiospora selenospora]
MDKSSSTTIKARAWTIAYYALLSRLFIWAVAVASHALVQDYDSALELILPIGTGPQRLFKSIFGVFLRWDAFYFLHIAESGYVFEQAHAFFPLLPALMRLVAGTVLYPIQQYLTYSQTLVLAGSIVANVSFIIAAVQLYRLTNLLFGRERFAFLTALLYVLTPSGIFMSAIYTESLFSALTFTGMILMTQKRYFMAAIVWSISSTARSNGILYSGFFIYEFLVRMDFNCSTMQKLWAVVKTGFLCLVTLLGFLAVQAYGFSLYCGEKRSTLDPRPWCDNTPPLIYNFVQEFYWNVGFMRYYEVKQIPNFLFAAPMLTLSTAGVLYYIFYDIGRVLTLGRVTSFPPRDKSNPPFMSTTTFPYIALWGLLLMINITTMHIQIITRAFSCMPPVYWFAAHQFEGQTFGSGKDKAIVGFFVMYGLVGIVLFANFFPPA